MPMTMPGLSALKPARPGTKPCRSGVTNWSAKYPYTTVGTPASTSSTGRTMRRTPVAAYSLR